ncbi:MAG: hypothetical protein ABSH19_08200, partial [Opitutales bacterium]
PAELNLPTVSGAPLPGSPADATLTVLTAKQNNLFIFEGRIYDLPSLRAELLQHHRPPGSAPAVLLLKAGRNVTVQTLLEICTLARAAGFSTVQIAAEESQSGAIPQNPDASPASP